MPEFQQLRNDFQSSMQECLLISQSEKDFWLMQINTLPIHTLEGVLASVKAKNELMNRFIDVVLANDDAKNLLSMLKNMIKNIKFKAFKMDEKHIQSKDEEKLKKIIDILNYE